MDLTGTLDKFGKYERYQLSVVSGLTILYSGSQSHNHIISSIHFTIAHFTNIQSITTFLNEKQITLTDPQFHYPAITLFHSLIPTSMGSLKGHSPNAHKDPGCKVQQLIRLYTSLFFSLQSFSSIQFSTVVSFTNHNRQNRNR